MDEPLIPEAKGPQVKVAKQPRAKKNVMNAVKQDHGQGGRKKPSEIIQQYLMQQLNDPRAVNAFMTAMYQQIQAKTMRLIQFGNTVFMAKQKGPGWIDVHVFTEDSPKTLVHRFQQAYGWAKQHEFTKITSTLTDANMGQLVKAAGLPVTLQQTQINNGKQMVPAYQMTMEVK